MTCPTWWFCGPASLMVWVPKLASEDIHQHWVPLLPTVSLLEEATPVKYQGGSLSGVKTSWANQTLTMGLSVGSLGQAGLTVPKV